MSTVETVQTWWDIHSTDPHENQINAPHTICGSRVKYHVCSRERVDTEHSNEIRYTVFVY